MSHAVPAIERAYIRWHATEVEILEKFALFQRSRNISETTIKNRADLIRGYAKALGGELLTATTEQLRGYLARPGIAPGTMRTERSALQAFYRWLVDDGYITHDPTEKLHPVRVPRTLPRPFQPYQIEAMLRRCRRRTQAMIKLGYYQGFRVAQIARVQGEDIDIRVGQIRTVGKGNKERWLPLHPEIAELSQAMPRRGYWFPARNKPGEHVLPASVTDLISNCIRRVGITDKRLTPHSLRHSFGNALAEAEVDIRVIQELMMHEQLSSTQIYTYVSPKRQAAGLAKLPNIRG